MNITDNNTTKKYYSLLELTGSIESVINKTYSSSYWVKAEIAKLNYYPKSGHCYPDLVEKEKGKVLAQIRATLWAGNFNTVSSKFLKVTGEPLSDGMTVLLRASVNFHPVYGLSLHIVDIEPAFTLGELLKEKLESIEKLKKQGIFNNNKNLETPPVFSRLAVISVETSKGYHDFSNILKNNDWGYSFFQMLFPALLQGTGSINSISEQLNRISQVKEYFDAVVIIRGGGGDVGLSSYDNYKLAKKVALFPLPVISGIGHATNETVVEQVSFVNKITPTDVAYYLIQRFHNFLGRVNESEGRLANRLGEVLGYERNRLADMGIAIKRITDTGLYNSKLDLFKVKHDINRLVLSSVSANKNVLRSISDSVSSGANIVRKSGEMQIEEINNRLILAVNSTCTSNKNIIDGLSDKIRLLDPVNVLKRGYSITHINGKAIVNTDNLNKEDVIETKFFEGSIKSKIISVENAKD